MENPIPAFSLPGGQGQVDQLQTGGTIWWGVPGISFCLIDSRPGNGASNLEIPAVTDPTPPPSKKNQKTKKRNAYKEAEKLDRTHIACWWAHKMIQPVWKRV